MILVCLDIGTLTLDTVYRMCIVKGMVNLLNPDGGQSLLCLAKSAVWPIYYLRTSYGTIGV